MVTAGAMGGAGSSGSTSGIKKPRLINSQTTTSHTSTSNTTPPRSFDTSSSHQGLLFQSHFIERFHIYVQFLCGVGISMFRVCRGRELSRVC